MPSGGDASPWLSCDVSVDTAQRSFNAFDEPERSQPFVCGRRACCAQPLGCRAHPISPGLTAGLGDRERAVEDSKCELSVIEERACCAHQTNTHPGGARDLILRESQRCSAAALARCSSSECGSSNRTLAGGEVTPHDVGSEDERSRSSLVALKALDDQRNAQPLARPSPVAAIDEVLDTVVSYPGGRRDLLAALRDTANESIELVRRNLREKESESVQRERGNRSGHGATLPSPRISAAGLLVSSSRRSRWAAAPSRIPVSGRSDAPLLPAFAAANFVHRRGVCCTGKRCRPAYHRRS